jgi:hypothetical protein
MFIPNICIMSMMKELKSKIKQAHQMRLAADAHASIENYDAAIDISHEIAQIGLPPNFDESRAGPQSGKLLKAREMAKDRINFLEKSRCHYQLNMDYMNTQSFSNGILFYPGAYTDFGPLSFFAQVKGIRQVVYADRIPIHPSFLKDSLKKHLPDFTISGFRPLLFDELLHSPFRVQVLRKMVQTADKLKAEAEKQITKSVYKNDDVIDDYLIPGVQMYITRKGKTVVFTYFFEEGAAVFNSLMRSGYDETVFVLQDHGIIGPHFGGESPLYQSLKKSGNLPGFLLVSMGATRPWPGYKAVNPPLYIKRGQMHQYMRVIFRREDMPAAFNG